MKTPTATDEGPELPLTPSEIQFKGSNGIWLPIDTPTSAIPQPGAIRQRLAALRLQLGAILREIAALTKAERR